MNNEKTAALLTAVRESGPWLERFTREAYTPAFQSYREQFSPAWTAAAREAEEEGLPALAEALLDGMEADWARQRFWNRGRAKMDSQQMLVYYLSPMLLGEEDPACRRLAELLRDGWTARRPKEAYRIAGQRTLQKGFRLTILGIPMPEKQTEEED